MKCEDGNSTVFMASFGDGAIKIFDRRLEEDERAVHVDLVVTSANSFSVYGQKLTSKWRVISSAGTVSPPSKQSPTAALAMTTSM